MPPPGSDISFYKKIFDLMTEATGILICGGDWNIRLNSKLDSSEESIQTPLHKKLRIGCDRSLERLLKES